MLERKGRIIWHYIIAGFIYFNFKVVIFKLSSQKCFLWGEEPFTRTFLSADAVNPSGLGNPNKSLQAIPPWFFIFLLALLAGGADLHLEQLGSESWPSDEREISKLSGCYRHCYWKACLLRQARRSWNPRFYFSHYSTRQPQNLSSSHQSCFNNDLE